MDFLPEMLRPNLTLVFQAALFIVLLLLLNKLMFKPLLELMDKRARAAEEPKHIAEKLSLEAEELETKVRSLFAQAKEKADSVLAESMKGASDTATARVAEARKQAIESMEESRNKILASQAEARKELDAEAEKLAGQITDNILGGI